jgi:ATP-dependent DNA helicase RecQ
VGHDFRPEYRNLKNIIKHWAMCLSSVLPLQLPKSSGRYSNLDMCDTKASFNRPNLYYEVRTQNKKNVESDIIRFINSTKGSLELFIACRKKKWRQLPKAG